MLEKRLSSFRKCSTKIVVLLAPIIAKCAVCHQRVYSDPWSWKISAHVIWMMLNKASTSILPTGRITTFKFLVIWLLVYGYIWLLVSFEVELYDYYLTKRFLLLFNPLYWAEMINRMNGSVVTLIWNKFENFNLKPLIYECPKKLTKTFISFYSETTQITQI